MIETLGQTVKDFWKFSENFQLVIADEVRSLKLFCRFNRLRTINIHQFIERLTFKEGLIYTVLLLVRQDYGHAQKATLNSIFLSRKFFQYSAQDCFVALLRLSDFSDEYKNC